MLVSLFKMVKRAEQVNKELSLLQKLDEAQSKRAKNKSLALITSPKGLSAVFLVGAAKGFITPSIAGQLKSMAVIFGKTNLDAWLTGEELENIE